MGIFGPAGIALALALAPVDAPGQPQAGVDEAAVPREAAAFMSAYEAELRAGDRAALPLRYHRGGAWRVGHGERVFDSWATIRDSYATRWRPPTSFAWTELSYEPLGRDAVVVVGRFSWGRGEGQAPLVGSYTGLLVREDGELRIRLEDESVAPTP